MEPTQLKPKMSPKDFFLHLGAIVALYVSAISFITLVFQIVNIAFPDALNSYYDPYSSILRTAVASLIIALPLYYFFSWLLSRDYKASPEKRNLMIRKWLIYFTLFIAGVTIAIDLIVLVNQLLAGEVAMRFVLKALSVLVVVGTVFGYYIQDLRDEGQKNYRKIFAWVSGVVVLATIIGGFVIMGSPVKQRNLRFDTQRVQDLMSIQYQIVNEWQTKGSIPQNLSELNDAISGFVVPSDPQTKTVYEYKKSSATAFELCAVFSLPSSEKTSKPNVDPSLTYLIDNWQHGAGRTCFERTIDPARYPVIPAQPKKF